MPPLSGQKTNALPLNLYRLQIFGSIPMMNMQCIIMQWSATQLSIWRRLTQLALTIIPHGNQVKMPFHEGHNIAFQNQVTHQLSCLVLISTKRSLMGFPDRFVAARKGLTTL